MNKGQKSLPLGSFHSCYLNNQGREIRNESDRKGLNVMEEDWGKKENQVLLVCLNGG